MQIAGVSLGTRIRGADVIAESTITGSVLQHHIPTLTRLMMSCPEKEVRLGALELIGTLLNHGMAHPMDVLSMLVALQGDEESKIRNTALAILITQDEKHSSFLDNR
jgi:hypothetical protein